ncbi:Serine/threonine protein kinase PrkC, regulator of stationary phase [Minicystis rosea]|nr:Serine/threonine protein kinase PrkC, regulator of stationary phase [Minicystis rosea]
MNEGHQQQRYRVVERLASGGMAEVFIAESAGIEGFKKQVAIKRVLPSLSEKKRFIAMFLDEARLSANLTHSNVAQVFDIGVGDNAYFIVMEYVDGADLKAVIEHLRRGGRVFPIEHACYIAERLCEGLTYAHELRGGDGKPLEIIHRDMSPPNVLITKHGEVKIVDFGLAKATSQLEKSEAGVIKGKYGYLSPEAAQGQAIDHRTDIFAVGIILWEMLSGRRLFSGDTDFATVKLVREAVIPSLRELNPAVPAELEKIIARALAREPDKRYATARDFGRDLTAFLFRHGHPVTAYDIAELVRTVVAQRRKSQPEKSSIIDKLIEEALLEFTSLQDDKNPTAPAARPDEPLKVGFEDIGSWADELAAPAMSVRSPSVTKKAPAAEESAPEAAAPKATKAEPAKASAAPESTKAPPSSTIERAEESDEPAPPPAKGKSSMTAVVVLVVAAVVAAGAWFGGLIPH